jgi:hypothetical protein
MVPINPQKSHGDSFHETGEARCFSSASNAGRNVATYMDGGCSYREFHVRDGSAGNARDYDTGRRERIYRGI